MMNTTLKKNKMNKLWILLLLLPLLGFSCEVDPEETSEEAKISSPKNGSSYVESDDIPFQLEQTGGNTQGLDVHLDGQRINIQPGDMLPELGPGEHELKLIEGGQTLDEISFYISELSGYTFRFKSAVNIYYPGCWPETNIRTTLVKDNPDWSAFLPKIFARSPEWNELVAYWSAVRQRSLRNWDYSPNCSTDGHGTRSEPSPRDDVFVDFHIKSRQFLDRSFSKPVTVDFKAATERLPLCTATNHFLRSTAGLHRFPAESPSCWRRLYKNNIKDMIKRGEIDFSKNRVVVLKEKCPEACGEWSLYHELVAIYEWNGVLHIMIKDRVKEAYARPDASCDAIVQCHSTLLILDYVKDLPVKWIEMD